MGLQIQAKTWENVAANADIDPEDVRTDYSGRGMFGRTCVGIVGDTNTLVDFVKAVVEDAVAEDFTDDVLTGLYEEISTVQTDSMGTRSVFYWPRITVL